MGPPNPAVEASASPIVGAFRSALLGQAVIASLIFAVALLAWAVLRGRQRRQHAPAGRTMLQFGFGGLWVFDGILQAQPMMVTGLSSQVIAPSTADSPHWAQDVVSLGGTGGVTEAAITWQRSAGGAMDVGRAGRMGAGR
jgi:hypothetical protein